MEVILSGEYRLDDYGNFRFTDKGGNEHKIGTKRENFGDLCVIVTENPDRAVTLTYDTYKNRPYIVGIELVEGKIEVDPSKATEQQVPPETKPSVAPKAQFAPQEIGLWFKEMGCRIGDGSIEKDFPKLCVKIKTEYYKKMSQVTGIPMWEKKEE